MKINEFHRQMKQIDQKKRIRNERRKTKQPQQTPKCVFDSPIARRFRSIEIKIEINRQHRSAGEYIKCTRSITRTQDKQKHYAMNVERKKNLKKRRKCENTVKKNM